MDLKLEAKVIQVIANASPLEVDPSRIVVGGSSAGANIVGSLTIVNYKGDADNRRLLEYV